MNCLIGKVLAYTPNYSALFKLAFLITVLSTKPPIINKSSKINKFYYFTLSYVLNWLVSIWTKIINLFIFEFITFYNLLNILRIGFYGPILIHIFLKLLFY
jgi:hypothetical protein